MTVFSSTEPRLPLAVVWSQLTSGEKHWWETKGSWKGHWGKGIGIDGAKLGEVRGMGCSLICLWCVCHGGSVCSCLCVCAPPAPRLWGRDLQLRPSTPRTSYLFSVVLLVWWSPGQHHLWSLLQSRSTGTQAARSNFHLVTSHTGGRCWRTGDWLIQHHFTKEIRENRKQSQDFKKSETKNHEIKDLKLSSILQFPVDQF